MKLKFTSLLFILSFLSIGLFAQMKVVVMGSSTAFGTGASTYENSWAGKITSYLNRNTTDGLDTTFYNIAQPGYDTYQEMPDNFIPPANRPVPDVDYNITKALSFAPDVIIINLPSNDISYGYAKSEMMNNLRVMYNLASGQGARCYITTPQPRNDFTQDYRDSLVALIDSVNNTFGPFALDFWTDLVTLDGTNSLKDELRAFPSPIHVNDDGHQLLFEVVRDAYIFGLSGPVALRLTSFTGRMQNNSVELTWRTEQQSANTSFEIQRSADGQLFQTQSTQTVTEARQESVYTATDATPFEAKTFYRLKITEAGRVTYSAIINVMGSGKVLNITRLFTNNTGSNLTVEVSVQKSQMVYINIIGTTGIVLSKQKEFINQPGKTITIPVSGYASGQYYVKISTADGVSVVKAFIK